METKTYKWLLMQFVGWIMDNNCYRDEDGEINNYFTVNPGKKDKPCFKTSFPEYKGNWPQVKQAAYEDGIILGFRPRYGWFLGNERDLGNLLAQQHKGNETRISNLDKEIHYVMLLGDEYKLKMVLDAYNANREKELQFGQVQQAIKEFHAAMGIPYQEHLLPSLLNEPLVDTDEED